MGRKPAAEYKCAKHPTRVIQEWPSSSLRLTAASKADSQEQHSILRDHLVLRNKDGGKESYRSVLGSDLDPFDQPVDLIQGKSFISQPCTRSAAGAWTATATVGPTLEARREVVFVNPHWRFERVSTMPSSKRMP